MTVVKVTDWATGQELCSACMGTGYVAPFMLPGEDEPEEFICPACRADEYTSADEFFYVSDALMDGLSDKRVARAESSHLQEKSFTERSLAQEFAERKRAAGW